MPDSNHMVTQRGLFSALLPGRWEVGAIQHRRGTAHPALPARDDERTRMLHRRLPRSVVAVTAAMGMTVGLGLTAVAGGADLPAAAATVSPVPATVSDFTLYTEPDQGISFVYDLINGAKTSIDLTMYELQDTTAEDDLGAAAARGVDVRVILDHREESPNTTAFNYLSSHGVHVVWSSSAYYYTHEK